MVKNKVSEYSLTKINNNLYTVQVFIKISYSIPISYGMKLARKKSFRNLILGTNGKKVIDIHVLWI